MRLCLNMIVKDEAHIIEETLNNIKDYISYWIISDTGSTDNTKEVIQNFFSRHNIPGHLFQEKWKDFGTNRTLALKSCYPYRKKFDYIWVFDADDLVVGNLVLPTDKSFDLYSLKYGTGFTYTRHQLFKASEKWRYVGVLHEYPECISKKDITSSLIEGDYYIDSRRLGARNKNEDKYLRDVKTLLQGLRNEPKNGRYMFYLAQSYMDAGDFKNAIKWYQKRIEMQGWFEEVYYSYYRIATCMQNLYYKWELVEKAFLQGWLYLQSRAEPLYEIAKHYRLKNNFSKAYPYAKQASSIPFPDKQLLFLFQDVYDYQAMYEYLVASHYTQRYIESFNVGNALLVRNLPEEERIKIQKLRDMNIKFILDTSINYPVKQIINIKKKTDKSQNLIFTITTCKRYDLFSKTINSFLNCCNDVLKIDKWVCVDDNSNAEDREKMQKLYPFFEFVFKSEAEKGHVQSMNIIYEKIKDYKYVCHMEDDWQFFEKRNYLIESINILESDQKLGQLLFNVNYAQRDSCRSIIGGSIKYHNNLRYIEHEYYPPGKEYDSFISRNAGKSTQAYWPHYSLRPSVLKVSVLQEVGDYKNETGHFEMDYSHRYVGKGYKSAFLDTICSYHIGKCTWEKGDNSYSLNGVNQFNNVQKNEEEVVETGETLNIGISEDDWLIVPNMDSIGNDIKYIQAEIDILKGLALSDPNCIGFNSLGYMKSSISPQSLWTDVSTQFPNFKMYIIKERYQD